MHITYTPHPSDSWKEVTYMARPRAPVQPVRPLNIDVLDLEGVRLGDMII